MADTFRFPAVGLGTYLSEGEELKLAVLKAIEVGYKHIDTAKIYENEAIIGEALNTSGIKRENIYLTSKVWNDVTTYEQTIAAFEQTIKNLKTDYLDLYLIHFPGTKERDREVWRALEDLYEKGLVKAIGVSNFFVNHLDDLLETAKISPMVNQVEISPVNQQWDLHEYCWNFDIALMAYGSFMKGNNLNNPILVKIAKKHNKTVQQVILRWLLERGIFVIPKSVTASRIEENFQIRDFSLSNIEMEKIADLNTDTIYYAEPVER